jgi:hypothetical protein
MQDKRNKPANDNDATGKNQEKDIRQNAAIPNDSIREVPDLDGDGMIGNTGGMYGDTTYTGGSISSDTDFVEDAPHKTEEDEE